MQMSPNTAVTKNGDPFKPEIVAPSYQYKNYFADWLKLGASYAFQRSQDPSKPVYNTEWHGQGTLAWRDETISKEYIEFAVWCGLYFGEALNVAWYVNELY